MKACLLLLLQRESEKEFKVSQEIATIEVGHKNDVKDVTLVALT